MIARRDPVTGLSQLTLADDDDDDENQKPQLTPEEIRAKQQREREEKQRRYDEARAKIFGTSTTTNTNSGSKSGASSGASTPGTVTPPIGAGTRDSGGGRGGRGRGRGRGRNTENRGEYGRTVNQSTGGRELYDPNYSPKPGSSTERRGGYSGSNTGGGAPLHGYTMPRDEDQVIRAPRGPDGSGKGGFGFTRRGAKDS
jgi:hypothetical protein